MTLKRADLATLFGLPLVMERDDAIALVSELRSLFVRQFGRSLGTLETDLGELGEVFDPARPGSALRAALTRLPRPPTLHSQLLRRSALVVDPSGICLATPEARVVLAVLDDALSDTNLSAVVVPVSAPCTAQAELYSIYRHWVFQRVDAAIRLSTGKADTMRPLTAAWLMFLLVNGSRDQVTAVSRPSALGEQLRVEQAIGTILHAFADPIAKTSRPSRPFGIESNWVLSEASRRAPDVMGEHRGRPGEPKLHYIRRGSEDRTVAVVVRELLRRRNPPAASTILGAFETLVAEYRRHVPILASAGMAHESRSSTRQIRAELERALDGHPAAS